MADEHVFAVIMAGGKGTRLWPLSRRSLAKQFLSLGNGEKSMLQATAERAAALVDGSLERVIVVAGATQAELVRRQLPALPAHNLLLEPVGRNTAACISYAAFEISRREADAGMIVLPADHLYDDPDAWAETLRSAIGYAINSGELVTIGLEPSAPSPNYGYIRKGALLSEYARQQIYRVKAFVEKPDVKTAREYCRSGEYLWNTGTFCWRTEAFLHALEVYLPGHFREFSRCGDFDLQNDEFTAMYQALEKISVDYAIMEKAENVAVVEGHFGRIDLGNLTSLAEVYPQDVYENVLDGQVVCIDGENNIALDQTSEEGLTVLFGVSDLVVVRQDDVVFVCPKTKADQMKTLLHELKKKGYEAFL